MELAGKKVVVVGLGRSGIAAARLCAARGAEVIATDSARAESLSPEVSALPARLVLGGHADVPFCDCDLVVVSPGVPSFDGLDAAESAGVELVGELELAARFVKAPLIAVGGTNGKSTVTSLIAEMAQQAGLRTFAGGNLGTPLSEAVEQDWDLLVVEVSSFQLERVRQFRPDVSVLLHVTEDHLDRYPSFQAYAEAKGNAFREQYSDDLAVIPSGDECCREQAERGRARIVEFGAAGDFVVDQRLIIDSSCNEIYDLSESNLYGRHNALNAAACIAVARSRGWSPEVIRRALHSFVPLKHRMAFVRTVAGVRYYDDSKGTNVGASVTALLGLHEDKGVLIAGGRDKQGSYEPLRQALLEKGRGLVLLGEAAALIEKSVAGAVPVQRATDMLDAVKKARQLAQAGDAVLLSPACASFDMFTGYAERGRRFVEAVEFIAGAGGLEA